MYRTPQFLARRRQNVWANVVFVSVLVILFITAGGPLKVIKPWAESVSKPANWLGDIEVTAEREYLSYGTPSDGESHLLFGLPEESAPESADPVSAPVHIEGAWLYARTGGDCDLAPQLSIHLRQSDDAIFGYGLVAPTGCGSHRPEELDYAVVQGRRQDGVIVLTMLEKTVGHVLYRFEGALSTEGFVGRLEGTDGKPVAEGLIFSLDPDSGSRL